jgi:hypothetical protein
MAYIGNTAEQQAFTPAVDFFSGNGVTTAFTLSRPVASVAQVQATIENVPQNPGTAFTVSGNTITFDGAPASGTNNIYVYYTSPITQVIQPGQGTVGTAQIQNGAVIPADLSTGGPSWDTSGNVGIGTSSPDARLRVNGGSNSLQARFSGADSRGLAISTFVSVGTNDNGVTYNAGVASDGQQVWQCGGTERMRINSSGNLQFNSGYGSVATAYGCRAWVNFNGTGTVAIRASGNVSSITDNGAADYTVNFTTAMPDTSYAVTGSAEYAGGAGGAVTPFADFGGTYTTTQVRIAIRALDFGFYDRPIVGVAIFR